MINRYWVLGILLAPALCAGPREQRVLRLDSPPYIPAGSPTPQHAPGVAPLPRAQFPHAYGNGLVSTPPGPLLSISPMQQKLELLGQELDQMNFFWVAGNGAEERFKALVVEVVRRGTDYPLRVFFKRACVLIAAKITPRDDYPAYVLAKARQCLAWYGFEST